HISWRLIRISRERWVIERVECIQVELEINFFPDLEVFYQRRIDRLIAQIATVPVPRGRNSHRVSRPDRRYGSYSRQNVTDRSVRIDHSRLEHPVARGILQTRVANQIYIRRDAHRCATLEKSSHRDLPSARNLSEDSVSVGQVFTAGTKGQ